MKQFKLIAAALFAALTFGFTGCQKDTADLILGTWNAVSYTATTTVSGLGEEIDGTQTMDETFEEGESTMTFNADGTMVMKSTDSETGESETQNANYTVKDDILTITFEDQKQEFTIVSIDKKEMSLRIDMEYSMEGASIKSEIVLKMKKA